MQERSAVNTRDKKTPHFLVWATGYHEFPKLVQEGSSMCVHVQMHIHIWVINMYVWVYAYIYTHTHTHEDM